MITWRRCVRRGRSGRAEPANGQIFGARRTGRRIVERNIRCDEGTQVANRSVIVSSRGGQRPNLGMSDKGGTANGGLARVDRHVAAYASTRCYDCFRRSEERRV